MKPRNKFELKVAASNSKLSPISNKVINWAINKLLSHPAFRTPSGTATCGDCGHKFVTDKKRTCIVCPSCGRKLEIHDTLKRSFENRISYSTLEVVDRFQVQRVFFLDTVFKKGVKAEYSNTEVCRLWLNEEGRIAITALKSNINSYYSGAFCWDSGIELRQFNDNHLSISDTFTFPHRSFIPVLRRNGILNVNMSHFHPFILMRKLIKDRRFETLAKSKNMDALAHFFNNEQHMDICWKPYLVAKRNGYIPEDFSLWCDMVRMINRCGKDIHSPKYICPDNLKHEHDRWRMRLDEIEHKRRQQDRMEELKESEENFLKSKSCFFGIVFGDGDIEVTVLDSIKAFKEESDRMHHCVFQCNYFDKEDSLILSAHDAEGNRIETIEFSLSQNRVVQSRGACNKNTAYHDRIINLVNSNAQLIQSARQKTA